MLNWILSWKELTVAREMRMNIGRKKYQCNNLENFLELENVKGEERGGLPPHPFLIHHT